MEADGFAGTAFPDVMIDAAAMTEGLRGWRADMGERNRDLASAHHSAREHAIKLVELARGLARSPEQEVMLSDELASVIRLQWSSEGQAAASQREVLGLRARLDERDAQAADLAARLEELDAQAADLAARLAAAAAQLASLKATRRYRLASRVAEPLDRLRKVRRWRT
jgi:chromosome segregation ATPase